MLELSGINYWAVLVATAISMAVGSFWYSPAGFGKVWSKATGVDMMKLPKKYANTAIGITALSALIQAFVLAVLVHNLVLTTVAKGLELGLVLWLGFVAASTISESLYARRGWKFWSLNSGFYLLMLLVNASIFAVWR